MMIKNLTISIAATFALGFGATACGGGSDAATDSAASAGEDGEFGGPGRWSAEQLCSLSSAQAVSAQFGDLKVEERAGIDDPEWTACSWSDASDPLAQGPMSISQYGGFASDALGLEVDLDIAGADMAGFSDNIGGAALVNAVVGDQMLEITFPVGTEGAQEFGTVVAALWVAAQGG